MHFGCASAIVGSWLKSRGMCCVEEVSVAVAVSGETCWMKQFGSPEES